MNKRGATVLELVTVLVVFGIMAGTALPAFYSTRAQTAVRHAADEFVVAHSLARAVAVRHARVTHLNIDAAAGRFWVEVDTTIARTGTTDTIGTVRDVSADGVSVTSTRAFVCFDARGLATPVWACPLGDLTTVFSRAGYVDTVRTSAVGKVLR